MLVLRSRVFPMNLKRTAMIVVVCAALLAWFSAAMTPGWRPPAIESAPTAIDTGGAALAAEVARLRQRLRPDVTPRERPRNPPSVGTRPEICPQALPGEVRIPPGRERARLSRSSARMVARRCPWHGTRMRKQNGVGWRSST